VKYDPLVSPEPKRWLAFAEGERLGAIEAFHKQIGTPASKPRLHAILHAIVETQLATGETPVQRALERLMRQGLDRHEALHAIGSVLSEQIYGALRSEAAGADPAADYVRKLDALTASGWKG
jgi:hypothetical protein